MPKRIQRRRVKGWRKPEGAVSVCRPGPFGNMFVVGVDGTAAECVSKFDNWLATTDKGRALAERAKRELRDKDLMCFCPLSSPCHADVWLRVANEPPAQEAAE